MSVGIELQTGINKKKPNTNRGRRVERNTKTIESTKTEVGQCFSMLERMDCSEAANGSHQCNSHR